MNKKKLILTVGMFLGSFAVINVGMFFFLKMTTPKIGPRAVEIAAIGTDSLRHADTTTVTPEIAHADTAAVMPADSVLPQIASADTSAAMPDLASSIESMTEPAVPPTIVPEEVNVPAVEEASVDSSDILSSTPRKEAESTAQSVMEGDIREMAKLAKLLEAMKPADAAAIATQLSTEQIIALMMRMKDRNAGKMLAELPVEQAARVAARMSQTALRTRGGS